ncbi:MAG TPA: asparagine synthase C-terminal domain-containing protein [Bacteroidales bacterium]|nr:asparagine synthase C-terminal domain-containing protein [Bacteroidales bacterium]
MQLARGQVVVTLDGQGADELLAGYHYFFGIFFKELLIKLKIRKLGTEILNYLKNHNDFYGIKTLLYFLLPEKLKTGVRINEKGYLQRDFAEQFRNTSIISENLYDSKSLTDSLINHFEYKLEHLLKWEDRNSMWFSLEARVPFLDYRLVEKTLATPSEMIIRNGTTKHLLREAMKDILPEKIRSRNDKIGFGTPQEEWFRDEIWIDMVNKIIKSQ